MQDNVPVSFGDTGLILYEAEEIPEAFTWTFLAVRSALDVREAAADVNEILSEPGFASFSTNVLGMIQAGAALANPAYAAGIEVAKFVAQAGARRLMKKATASWARSRPASSGPNIIRRASGRATRCTT